ncbi:uncharacterized protein METZ01_LOCUS364200, partial [marine metagenome]
MRISADMVTTVHITAVSVAHFVSGGINDAHGKSGTQSKRDKRSLAHYSRQYRIRSDPSDGLQRSRGSARYEEAYTRRHNIGTRLREGSNL